MLLSELTEATGDPQIPTLPAVLNAIESRRHLDIFSRLSWRGEDLRDVQVRVLRFHRGRRCTLELVVRTAGGVRLLVGKVYAEDGLPVYQAMVRISRGGFGPKAEFSIPEPLVFLPAMQFVLQEKVEGASAERLFLTGKERDCILAAERSARWLARFHAVAPKAGPVFYPNNYLTALQRWSCRIAELGEPLARKARRLFHRLELAASSLGPIEMCPGHGDFKPPHVILGNGRTTTCDWDRFDVADPWRDVARFVVALERLALRHFGSMRALDAAANSFLKTYSATGRLGINLHLPFHMAATCVQFAKYDISQPITRWRDEMAALLDEGQRILETWK